MIRFNARFVFAREKIFDFLERKEARKEGNVVESWVKIGNGRSVLKERFVIKSYFHLVFAPCTRVLFYVCFIN